MLRSRSLEIFPTSDDREALQTVADELNRDAMGSDTSERWIIVQTAIWQSLQEVKS